MWMPQEGVFAQEPADEPRLRAVDGCVKHARRRSPADAGPPDPGVPCRSAPREGRCPTAAPVFGNVSLEHLAKAVISVTRA